MKITCPNCGHENVSNDGNLNFCEACGRALPHTSNDFEYNFGEPTQNVQSPNRLAEILGADNGPYGTPTNLIQTKKHPARLNKIKKDVFGISIAMLVIFVIRFVSNLTALSDVDDLKTLIAENSRSLPKDFVAMIGEYVQLYYPALIISLVCVVFTIIICVIVGKNKSWSFPLQNPSIFDAYKKLTILFVALFIVVVVYFSIEISFARKSLDVYAYLEKLGAIESTEMATAIGVLIGSSGAFVANAIMAIVGIVYCNTIATSRVK